MHVFNRYILKNLILSTVFITFILSAVILLTQSLRFLELIIESGASVSTFWVLTFLALPRFLEILIPVSVMIATIFVYGRLVENSELVVLRSSGFSPLRLAKPALILAIISSMILWFVTLWAAPYSLASLHKMRQIVQSQFSAMLIHERVFNRLGKDLTVYIQNRESDGSLTGVFIYDTSDRQTESATIMAKRGVLSETDDGYQVIVYDGSRQTINPKTRAVQMLKFDRYTIDLPLSGEIQERWQKPDERTLFDLLNPDMSVIRDVEHLREFQIELHRRITAPLLSFSFILIAASALILGPIQRRSQPGRVIFVVLATVLLQGLFLTAYNIALHSLFGLILMYAIVFIPIVTSLYFLSPASEKTRKILLNPSSEATS